MQGRLLQLELFNNYVNFGHMPEEWDEYRQTYGTRLICSPSSDVGNFVGEWTQYRISSVRAGNSGSIIDITVEVLE